jgi:uncharacterized protein
LKKIQWIPLFALLFIFVGSLTVLASPLPERPTSFVIDEGQVLSDAVEKNINQRLQKIKQKEGTEIFVVTLNSTQGESIENYTTDLFNIWNVGGTNRNGVLYVTALQDRKVRIMYGSGVSNQYSDVALKKLIDEEIIPLYKEEKYEEGILKGIEGIVSHEKGFSPAFDSDDSLQSTQDKEKHVTLLYIGLWVSGIGLFCTLMVIIVYAIYSNKQRKKEEEEKRKEIQQKLEEENNASMVLKKEVQYKLEEPNKEFLRSSKNHSKTTTKKSTSSSRSSSSSSSSLMSTSSFRHSYYDAGYYDSGGSGSYGGDGGASGSW